MSDVGLPGLDLREQIVRIDRAIAETHKLQAESDKFHAETLKLGRDRWLAPFIAIATLVAAITGAVAGFAALFRVYGH